MTPRPTLAPPDAIDLQIHTVHSDGTWTPPALIDHVRSRGFRVIAVTDHDTAAGIDEVKRLGEDADVIVVPGVEATASWHGRLAHVLCYAPDSIGAPLRDLIRGTVERMEANTQGVFDELHRRGYRFPRQAEVLARSGGEPRRPADNATLLVAHGYAPDMDAAVRMIADAGYHIASAPLGDVAAAAHTTGAVAILAHPGRGGGEIEDYPPDLLLTMLEEVPLDGIEAYYPLHTADQTVAYTQLAQEKHLLVSAGSDSHGPDRRLPVAYPAAMIGSLLARLDIEVEPG